MNTKSAEFEQWKQEARNGKEDFVVALVDRILKEAVVGQFSDLHFQPQKEVMELRWRHDGVLHRLGQLPGEMTPQISARLKVLAGLLTYQTDRPQEGRIRQSPGQNTGTEIRVSTIPTLFGERVAIRFFAHQDRFRHPDELGFPEDIRQALLDATDRTGSAILVTGKAGSGKTTTAYALLRRLVEQNQTLRSIMTLEDPVEQAIEGIDQVEPDDRIGFSLYNMIKYVMRQDPEVLMVGEIRDRPTAEAVFQAALTGHLLISTFHAGNTVEAVTRLMELGIEPYLIRTGLGCLLSQRLVRKLCSCARTVEENLSVQIDAESYRWTEYRMPVGCQDCHGTGYRGRTLIAELFPLSDTLIRKELIRKQDSRSIKKIALENGMIPLSDRAAELVRQGITSPAEIQRVF